MLKKLIAISPLLVIGALAYLSFSPRNEVKGQAPQVNNSGLWTVVNISDGDTLKVRNKQGEELKVRLCGIDADETAKRGKPAQSIYADQAKSYLESLVSQNNKVIVTQVEKDRYNRTVAEVWVNPGADNEELANGLLVMKGLARVFPQYVSRCPNASVLTRVEKEAKDRRLGVWGDVNSVAPWEFRKQQRSDTSR